MPTIESPLRYPGGKTQLAPFVTQILSDNELLSGVYAEPFAGGAGLALRLLLTGRVSEIWLNDIDPGLFSFWTSILAHSDDLCERIESTPVTMTEWHKQRKIVVGREVANVVDMAFATLFLNRTNRSGIIVQGGVIGGKDQTGPYKIDCRFNRGELISKVRRIAMYSDVIKLSRTDAKDCLQQWSRALPKRSLINIDPPYFIRGRELYTNFYREDDHRELAGIIRKLKRPWLLTYDDVPAVSALYSGLRIYRKSLVYYAQVKRRASELLVLSPDLIAPVELNVNSAETADVREIP